MIELYAKMTLPQRIAAGVFLAAATVALLFFFYISPKAGSVAELKQNNEQTRKTIKLQEAQLARIKDPGKINEFLPPEKLDTLASFDNKTLYSSEIPVFIELLEQVVEKSGGSDIRIEEGETSAVYIKMGRQNEIYEMKSLPLLVVFDASYASASNFLFQVKAMRRMLKLTKVELRSEDLTGRIKVMADMELYFAEEL